MKQYYIKLKAGESLFLADVLCRHLQIELPEALSLLECGSVWNNDSNTRIKQAGYKVSSQTILVQRPGFPVNPYPFDPGDIIYEDNDFFAVYKKHFFPTVPTPYADINSLVFGLNKWLESARPGQRAYAVNRLDLDTRGLVLLAKHKKAEAALHSMFQDRRMKKWYLARTEAFPAPRTRYLIHDSLSWKGKVKPACSYVSLVKAESDSFCFLVLPRTGRTHQIRKHFQKYIHPVMGDNVYGPYRREDRLELCCICYLFRHPFTGCKLRLYHVPADWNPAGLP